MNTSKSKPDLLAETSRGESLRILAQLEHGARAPAHAARPSGWTIDGWTIGLFALLLLMCSVAWIMHDKTITPQTFRQGYSGGVTSAPARRSAPPSAEHAPQGQQAAAIINMPPAALADGDSAVAAEDGAETPAHSAQRRTAASVSPALPASWASAPQAARALATQHKPPSLPVRATPPATNAAVAGATAQIGDTDVTLLTALVAHANKTAAVTPERPRDVVERQEGDSTAPLLTRCKQLGLIEGMLCRSRICSGRWESDAACRAPSH
ncbi:hypothetical protein [Duganella sp. BuS-21]|uniref:hypothetical protein n=1 Tax=Duganella sp. BuS-21 TaxID=2943848 RepID=UPI0035A64509